MCAASRIMFGYYGFAVTPVYATGGAFLLFHMLSLKETLLLPVKWLMMPENL